MSEANSDETRAEEMTEMARRFARIRRKYGPTTDWPYQTISLFSARLLEDLEIIDSLQKELADG